MLQVFGHFEAPVEMILSLVVTVMTAYFSYRISTSLFKSIQFARRNNHAVNGRYHYLFGFMVIILATQVHTMQLMQNGNSRPLYN